MSDQRGWEWRGRRERAIGTYHEDGGDLGASIGGDDGQGGEEGDGHSAIISKSSAGGESGGAGAVAVGSVKCRCVTDGGHG